LVGVVRGYRDHEAGVLQEVTAARSRAAADPNRTDTAENDLSHSLQRLFAVAEAYPELKADANFRQLSDRLVAIEEDLQFARRYFNGSVRDFRNLAESFPGNLIAGLFAFKPDNFFEVDSAFERLAPRVEL
jgi:LemA protein